MSDEPELLQNEAQALVVAAANKESVAVDRLRTFKQFIAPASTPTPSDAWRSPCSTEGLSRPGAPSNSRRWCSMRGGTSDRSTTNKPQRGIQAHGLRRSSAGS